MGKGKKRRTPAERVWDRTSRTYGTLMHRIECAQAGHAEERERAAFWSRMRAAELPAVA